MNRVKHPLSKYYGQDYPILQYVDDTLIILPTDAKQPILLKGLLRSFTHSTTFKVNYSKYFLVPINISEEKVIHLANTIGCQVAKMPFTYLGLPLGATRPSVENLMPFLNKIEKG
jgi:hypothetical protein